MRRSRCGSFWLVVIWSELYISPCWEFGIQRRHLDRTAAVIEIFYYKVEPMLSIYIVYACIYSTLTYLNPKFEMRLPKCLA